MNSVEESRMHSLMEFILFPAVILHELSHLLVYRAAGIESEMNLYCFSREQKRSHVQRFEPAPVGVDLLSTIAPYSLLILAFGSIPYMHNLSAQLSLPKASVFNPLYITGFGLVVVGQPSKPDLNSFLASARYTNGFNIAIIDRLRAGIAIWTVSLWLFASGYFTTANTARMLLGTFGLAFVFAIGLVAYDLFNTTWKQKEAEVQQSIGKILFDQYQYEQSQSHMERVLELDSDNAVARSSYAVALLKQERIEAAYEQSEKALSLAPDSFICQINHAAVLLEQDEIERAEHHCKQALEIDDSISLTHINYAEVLLKQGDLKAAKKRCQMALDREPPHQNIHTNYAEVLAEQGKPQAAEEQYEHALEIAPDDPDVHEEYAKFLEAQSREEDAAEHFQTAANAPVTESVPGLEPSGE